MSLPKNPKEWHWNKRFLMPKAYLYKLHVLLGYSPKKIAELHKSMIGISVSTRVVRDYLHAYKIYSPAAKTEKETRKYGIIGSRHKAADYLINRLFHRQGVKSFLDKISERKRKPILNLFFTKVSTRRPLTRLEMKTIVFIVRNYAISPRAVDLIIPNRKVLINWPKIEQFRQRIDVSVVEFCRKIGLDRRNYIRIQKKNKEAVGLRFTARKIEDAYYLHCERRKGLILMPSEISKERRE